MSNRTANIIAVFLLIFVFLIAFLSVKNDSLTMDEVAHLPAGYGYLTQKDMRLNPEHPPLIKDLGALPLLFIKNIKFPSEIPAWKSDINGQWNFGRYFLYNTGNPADKMILWGRMPMILILILLGFFIFKWAKELFGNKAGLLALFLFSFSPTLLAHGRLVTTDVGAAAGVTVATYYFLKSLKSPVKKNIIIAGIVFGIAQLLKFSAVLLVPFFGIIGLVWWLKKSGTFLQTIRTGFLVFLIGFLLIWPVYQFHTWNYPKDRQVSDTEFYLKDTPEFIKKPIIFASDKPILRPYALYLTGVSMVFQRVAGGNTTYFLGEVSNIGWRSYFPIVYLIKEPLAFHILTLIALLYAACLVRRSLGGGGAIKNRICVWLRLHFPEFSMLVFVGIYWAVSIQGNLNIGIRHLLPVFPFTILLVSGAVSNLLKEPFLKLKCFLLAFLISWQAVSVISVFPHFLAYFNESVGGPESGYKYVVDSNLDWGQDLKGLKNWVEKNGIDTIYLDYFGGGDPQYYLGTKFSPWWGSRNPKELPKGSYLAVSASFLQGGRGKKIPGLQAPEGYYLWLNEYSPVAKIGYSIFIYKIEEINISSPDSAEASSID
ncbi:MAG: hypothetical protein COX92_01575 [Candidatus Nealsonbacteria bacterium CG_4_10_14_0_2_um_filter_40_15]|uniref:Glycosyltransferase RgtA/B/C/D-like domain-containing protein n=2 Tax=Candidatus Nealsoniibacteriota TaxID=1817911 RepID=A0A2M7UU84_9BACT|nr:MAG: hypothetical protein COX92_01575 [Candidatus Nealsonbacteria bacterium CG_4_10_14_0_2_um_filter_40_15]